VAPAIKACYTAGIDVRMVTGDNLDTAIAIAKDAGILNDSHFEKDATTLSGFRTKPKVAMEGKAFRTAVYIEDKETGKKEFDQDAFDEIWPHLRVLARQARFQLGDRAPARFEGMCVRGLLGRGFVDGVRGEEHPQPRAVIDDGSFDPKYAVEPNLHASLFERLPQCRRFERLSGLDAACGDPPPLAVSGLPDHEEPIALAHEDQHEGPGRQAAGHQARNGFWRMIVSPRSAPTDTHTTGMPAISSMRRR
jgi:hypothetical protein